MPIPNTLIYMAEAESRKQGRLITAYDLVRDAIIKRNSVKGAADELGVVTGTIRNQLKKAKKRVITRLVAQAVIVDVDE